MNFKLAYILPLALFIPQPVAWSQQQRIATIATKTSRPLSDLSQALVLKEGWLVDYEDPAYVYLGDLLDVTQTQTSQSFRAGNPGAVFWGVRSSPVTFTFPFRTEPPALTDPAALISTLLAVNQQVGNPGIFKVVPNGKHLQIIPTQAKNFSGVLVPQVNALDQALSFPTAVRSGLEIVNLISKQLRSAGFNVGVGTIPTNYLTQTEMSIGAAGEPARNILIEMINELHWTNKNINAPTSQLVWRVLCAPDPKKPAFMINLELARTEADAPGGGQIIVTIH
jgi:hypothetical protein